MTPINLSSLVITCPGFFYLNHPRFKTATNSLQKKKNPDDLKSLLPRQQAYRQLRPVRMYVNCNSNVMDDVAQ